VSLTATSMTLGSPLYMSPEQVRSSKTVDARTDVWALGIIAYELLAGVQPFEAETVTGLCAKIVADEPVPLRSVRPDVPPAFEAVVLRCLEKSPASRYQSVAELAAALRPFASPEGRASVARIARTGGGAKPTLVSAHDRVSQPDARASNPGPSQPGVSGPGAAGPGALRPSVPTPVQPSAPGASTPSRPQPSDATDGYAETVASWQASADRRGRQVKTAGAATAGLVALAVFTLVAAKWPRAAVPPAGPPPAVSVSAASVIDLAAPAVTVAAPAATVAAPLPEASALPSTPTLEEKRAEPAVPVAPSGARASGPPRHPSSVKAAVGPSPSARTTDDLLQDRK